MNKKIASEFAIGTILLIAVAVGFVFVKRAHAPAQTQQKITQTPSAQANGTSEKIKLDQSYAKDQNNVYYWVDSFEMPYRVVDGADSNTFEIMGSQYGKDRDNVYYMGNILDGADPATFAVEDDYWAKDKNSVYFGNQKIEGADPATFEVINQYWSKDKNSVFDNGAKVAGADPVSFQVIDDGQFAKDNINVYRPGNAGQDKINIDARTFKVLGDNYLEDKDQVAYLLETQSDFRLVKITQADRNTFQALGSGFAKDKDRAYYMDKIIEGVDLGTFKLVSDNINEAKAVDKNNSYDCSNGDVCGMGCVITNLKTGKVTNDFQYPNCVQG